MLCKIILFPQTLMAERSGLNSEFSIWELRNRLCGGVVADVSASFAFLPRHYSVSRPCSIFTSLPPFLSPHILLFIDIKKPAWEWTASIKLLLCFQLKEWTQQLSQQWCWKTVKKIHFLLLTGSGLIPNPPQMSHPRPWPCGNKHT